MRGSPKDIQSRCEKLAHKDVTKKKGMSLQLAAGLYVLLDH